MGWVSCLEDANDRINDAIALGQLSTQSGHGEQKLSELFAMQQAIQRLIDKSKVQLGFLDDVEIATDPTVDLPARFREKEAQIVKLKAENEKLQLEVRKQGDVLSKLESAQAEMKQLKDEGFKLQNKLGKCRADSEELRRKLEKLEKELRRATR